MCTGHGACFAARRWLAACLSLHFHKPVFASSQYTHASPYTVLVTVWLLLAAPRNIAARHGPPPIWCLQEASSTMSLIVSDAHKETPALRNSKKNSFLTFFWLRNSK